MTETIVHHEPPEASKPRHRRRVLCVALAFAILASALSAFLVHRSITGELLSGDGRTGRFPGEPLEADFGERPDVRVPYQSGGTYTFEFSLRNHSSWAVRVVDSSAARVCSNPSPSPSARRRSRPGRSLPSVPSPSDPARRPWSASRPASPAASTTAPVHPAPSSPSPSATGSCGPRGRASSTSPGASRCLPLTLAPARRAPRSEPAATARRRATMRLMCVGGHEILPSGGQETARSWPTKPPTGGQLIWPR